MNKPDLVINPVIRGNGRSIIDNSNKYESFEKQVQLYKNSNTYKSQN